MRLTAIGFWEANQPRTYRTLRREGRAQWCDGRDCCSASCELTAKFSRYILRVIFKDVKRHRVASICTFAKAVKAKCASHQCLHVKREQHHVECKGMRSQEAGRFPTYAYMQQSPDMR